MKKIVITTLFLLTFGAYALYQNFGTAEAPLYVATNQTGTTNNTNQKTPIISSIQPTVPVDKTTVPTSTSSGSTSSGTSGNVSTKTPAPTPAPVTKNKYKDGTFTGDVADAYYGNVQVEAVIQSGKITDVLFLQYPNDRSTSVRKSQMALPILKSEVISSQSANVDAVSSVTYTSQAFIQSMGSALSQALNS